MFRLANKTNLHIWLLAFLTAFLALILALYKITDYDIWLHLASGRYIFEHKTIPTKDIFSFSAAGEHWVNHEWLFGFLSFLLYQIIGLNGLVIIKALTVASSYLLLWHLIYQTKADPVAGTAVLVLSAVSARGGFIIRPQILTYLFLAIFFNLLLLKNNRGYLFLLPLMIIWANWHAACILGLFLVGVFGVEEIYLYWQTREKTHLSEAGKLFLLGLGLLIVTNINPNTYQVLTYPLKGMSIIREMGVAEWQPTPFKGFLSYWFFLALLTIVLLINWRYSRPQDWLLFLPLAYLSIKSVRNTAIFTFLLSPILAYHLSLFFKRYALIQKWLSKWWWVVISCLIIGVGGVIYTASFFCLGIGVDTRLFPLGAVQYLDEHNITGPLYNAYRFGGYLIWTGYPRRLVFLDGRTDMYVLVLRKIQNQTLETIVNELYPVNTVLLRRPQNFSEWLTFKKGFSLSSEEWHLAYQDNLTLLYLRKKRSASP